MKSLAAITFCSLLHLFGTAQIAEVRTYGGLQADEGRHVVETANGYLVVGTTSSEDNGNNDVYVLQLNDDLTVNWAKTLGNDAADQGRSAVVTNEGDYLVLGQTSVGDHGGYDVVIYKLSPTGDLLWEKHYGTEDWDFATQIVKGVNNYYVCGTTYGQSPGDSRMWLFRVTSDGDLIDENTYDILPAAEAHDLSWYDGYLYMIGTRTFPGQDAQGVMRKLTPAGGVVWEDVRDSTAFEGLSLTVTEQGVISCYAMRDNAGGGYWNVMMIKADYDGVEEWSEFTDISEAGNQRPNACTWSGDVIIQANYTDIFGNGGLGCFINRVWFNGGWLSATVFGEGGDEEPFDVLSDSQGRIVIVGKTDSYGSDDDDVYLIRLPDQEVVSNYELDIVDLTDDNFFISVRENVRSNFRPYPNPASSVIKLGNEPVIWQLVDLQGRSVLAGWSSSANLSDLPAGPYLLIRTINGHVFRDHLVKQ